MLKKGKKFRHFRSKTEKDNRERVLKQAKSKRYQTKQKGFTFVELLISCFLVFFLIIGTLQLILFSLQVKKKANDNMKAAELASSKLEYFKSLPYESDELVEGIQTESFRGEGTYEAYWIEWRTFDIQPNMKMVELESFSKTSSQKKTRLVLFVSRELGF